MCSDYIVGHGRRVLSLLSLSLVTLSGCVYDSEHRCGPHQVLKMGNVEYCACDEYSVSTSNGCTPCGSNEVAGPSGCQCASGYGKLSTDGPCTLGADSGPLADSGMPTAAGLGASCDPVTNPCSDSKYNYCFVEPSKPGYCTSRCASELECSDGYACDVKTTPSVCRKPPQGLGKPCSSSSDCAGTEATFCDLVVTRSCVVEGCSLAVNDCFTGYACCDLSKYGLAKTICALGQCQ